MRSVLGCLLIAAAMVMVRPVAAEDNPAAPPSVEAANTKFACDLYSRLKSGDSNLFFSPFSISVALAMTESGARGQTASQMCDALGLTPLAKSQPAGLGGPNDLIDRGFADLIKHINSDAADGIEISTANALWGQDGFAFQQRFIASMAANYSGKLTNVDFHHAPQAAKTINDWVAQQTKDKIKDLIAPEALENARLVLTNAIYFKGDWDAAFDKNFTNDGPFHVTDYHDVTAPMMRAQREWPYFEDDTLQALAMPYKGKTLSMVVLLPRTDLASVEKRLTPDGLAELSKNLAEQEVKITFPKFKLTQRCSLNDPLKAMGMHDAFDAAKADFSGMATQEQLFISDVVHQAYVNVDEQGTEAAAATGVTMRMTAIRVQKPVPEFVADHPFLFYIRDNATGSILFLGRLTNPQ